MIILRPAGPADAQHGCLVGGGADHVRSLPIHDHRSLVGRRELVVHVELSGAPDADPVVDSGRAYLRRRMARLQRQDRAVAEARRLLTRWAEESRLLPDRERLAVLIRQRDADAARHVLEAWGRAHDDVVVTVTGPWPPFSFCEEADVS